MKILLFISLILLASVYVRAQASEIDISGSGSFGDARKSSAYHRAPTDEFDGAEAENASVTGFKFKPQKLFFEPGKARRLFKEEKEIKQANSENDQILETASQNETVEKFHWRPALIQSGLFLGFSMAIEFLHRKEPGSSLPDRSSATGRGR